MGPGIMSKSQASRLSLLYIVSVEMISIEKKPDIYLGILTASVKICSRNHDMYCFRTVLELLFQTFVALNIVELFFKCYSTNLVLYQNCSRTVVPDICLV